VLVVVSGVLVEVMLTAQVATFPLLAIINRIYHYWVERESNLNNRNYQRLHNPYKNKGMVFYNLVEEPDGAWVEE
jgi:hypothetical protein